MKPGFLFVGPTKSGTTWIDAYLRARGDVALPADTKETFFFDRLYHRGIDWYESQFPANARHICCAEVAPSLFHKPETAERAARELPDATIICTVRNPTDRVVSHYFHYRKEGEPSRSLELMIDQKPDIMQASLYYPNILRWEDFFGADKVKFLFYSDLAKNPDEFCRQLCSVLQIPFIAPDVTLRNQGINESGIPRNLLLARLARRSAHGLRMVGANRLVNLLRNEKLKAYAFSGGKDFAGEKARIRAQAKLLDPLFVYDRSALEDHVGRAIDG